MSTLILDGPEWWARAEPDKVAAVLGSDRLTYAELDAWAGRVAVDLAGRGVRAGDRVGIVAGNSLTYCALAVGILKLGAAAVPMSTRLTAGELRTLTDSSDPRLVVADESNTGRVTEAVGGDAGRDIVGVQALAGLREGPAASYPRAEGEPDDLAAIMYTSGTTGTPKGVIFTNRSILGFIHEWGLTESGFHHDMRLLMVLPLGSTPGLIWGIVHTFVRGATLYIQQRFDPAAALELLQRARITAMVGVPVLYEQIAAQPGFTDADLSAWDTAHVGGARVSDKLLRIYADKGVLLRQIYGMTEGGGSIMAVPRSHALTKADFCGRGSLFTRFRVVREDGSDCEPGEAGEILLKGPSMTPGYWRDPESTADAIRDGWMHSGDLGMVDEEGFLKMVDRVKDLIISGGMNISPIEIENVIDELEAVAEVAVLAAEDEKFGETPAAIVRLVDGHVGVEGIVAHCNARLADYKVPRYVVVADEPLPRMASGKLAKRVLREQHPDIATAHERVR
jgi:fatty-acyl-CoA synthase